jgi:hypothetical protein
MCRNNEIGRYILASILRSRGSMSDKVETWHLFICDFYYIAANVRRVFSVDKAQPTLPVLTTLNFRRY